MKHKTKSKKVKQIKNQNNGWPKEWLYICENSISIRDIYNLLVENNAVQVEIWEELGVMEIELQDDYSIDIELADETTFADERFLTLLHGQSVKTAFCVTVGCENIKLAEQIMKEITRQCCGVFCSDDEALHLIVQ